MTDTLSRVAQVLEARKGATPDSSYVASLYHKGLNKILEKVGEESIETIIAAKDAAISGDCSDVIYETADLWFHSMIMLAQLGQHPQAVLDELERRIGTSGHVQKLHELRLDCDADVVTLQVEQLGGIACHTGRESCFYRVYRDGEWHSVDAVIKDPHAIYHKGHSHD